MSHCCGGCGGEESSKNNSKALEKIDNDIAESPSTDNTKQKKTTPIGTWQPEKSYT